MNPDEPPIQYQTNAPLTAKQLADLFVRSGIRRPTDDLPRIEQMIRHGNLTITAWKGDLLVGVARSLTDFCFCCYLSDLAVDLAYQRSGIGRELVRLTKNAIGENSNLVLLSAPGAMEYYPKIGFAAVENGWMFKRAR
jgi:ribosomal protein S18 acetylase RimI-like enzyme